jgi:hypothetical protein
LYFFSCEEKQKSYNRSMRKILALFSALFLFFGIVFSTQAATASLYFSPASRSVDVGSTFTVTVYVSSATDSMNAAAGTISFPEDKLQVTSLSKTSSIFSLWAQEPSFSNSAGTVSFEGVVLNPGFTGNAGKILSITFRARAAGTAVVRFSNASVLANDGQGTNILATMGSAQFEIGNTGPVAPEGTTVTEVTNTPKASLVSSPTHPDSGKWYPVRTAVFSWSLPQGTTGVRTLANQIANSLPTTLHVPPVGTREISDLSDGVWYFHVQLRNENGWGAVTHQRFQIDTEKPEKMEISQIAGENPNLPRAVFRVDASDKTSGIDRFEVQIDNSTTSVWKDTGDHRYETPPLSPGRHVIVVKAFDKAGNSASAFSDFEIRGIAMPLITDYPKEMYADTLLAIRGKTFPLGSLEARAEWNGEEMKTQRVSADADGNFVFVFDEKLREGAYSFRFKAIDAEGGESAFTEPVVVGVHTPFVSKLGAKFVSYLTFGIIAIACLLLLAILGNYLLHHAHLFRKNVKRAISGVESDIHEVFAGLKNDVEHALRFLNHIRTKRELNDEEEKLRAHLEKSLEDAEKVIKREIRDIEKRIK